MNSWLLAKEYHQFSDSEFACVDGAVLYSGLILNDSVDHSGY